MISLQKNHTFKLSCLNSNISKLEAGVKIEETHPSPSFRGRQEGGGGPALGLRMGQCWGGVAGAVSQGEGLPRPRTCISQDEGCGSREGPGGAEEGAGAGPFPRVSRTLWGPGKVPSP